MAALFTRVGNKTARGNQGGRTKGQIRSFREELCHFITSWVRKEWTDLRPEHPLLAKVAGLTLLKTTFQRGQGFLGLPLAFLGSAKLTCFSI